MYPPVDRKGEVVLLSNSKWGLIIKPMSFVTTTMTRTVNMLDYGLIITDANNLYEAVLNSIKGSKWKEKSQKSLDDILTLVFDLSNSLINKTYRSMYENNFTIHERGRIRAIESYSVKDRAVRHVLCDKIFAPEIKNKIIYDNGASIKGRGISFSRKRFEAHLRKYYMHYKTNDGYIMFGDFSKYYDNILHKTAKQKLLSLVDYDEYISWLLDVIFDAFRIDFSGKESDLENAYEGIFNKLDYIKPDDLYKNKSYLEKSISIGDQLSQHIGILYANDIDTYVKIVRSQKYYGRYMDDWYLISKSKDELFDILDGIIEISKKLGIHINHKKTYVTKLSSRYKYLQVKYTLMDTGKVIKRINPKRITTMRHRLKTFKSKNSLGEISYENIENTFKSWMGSFYKLMSKQQRLGMIKLYECLFEKEISIVRNKMIIY